VDRLLEVLAERVRVFLQRQAVVVVDLATMAAAAVHGESMLYFLVLAAAADLHILLRHLPRPVPVLGQVPPLVMRAMVITVLLPVLEGLEGRYQMMELLVKMVEWY
jgi:hypothetical protein